MSNFHVGVVSGLCSRLRVLIGAIANCETTGRNLIVHWPEREPSETSGKFPAKMSDLWNHPYQEVDANGPFKKKTEQLKGSGEVWYRDCHIEPFLPWFIEPIGNYLDRLSPTDRVLSEIDTVHISKKIPMVGVNIRHSLKQPDAAEPDWFINRMRSMPEDCHFFLSADCKDVRDAIIREFPGRVQTTPKTYRYDFDGIVRACADLYILQKCDWMIGSNHSSYSQMAAFMRGAEYAGPHSKPGGISGGRYEDIWNPPEDGEAEYALGQK